VCLLVTLCASVVSAQITVARLKSLFIERFTRFVDWPRSALPEDATFVVCIMGSGEAADSLFELARATKWKGRPGEGRRVREPGDLDGCHLLYLSASESSRPPPLLKTMADKPLLTVSDTRGFAEQGVLIALYEEQGLMKFDINLPAVKRSGLVFSSQLLRLGRLVGEGAGPTRPVQSPRRH
jgi:hypothetical protein